MASVFLNVLNMNITASVIIIAVIIIRALIRKLPKKFSYILWSIPAVRLICPVSVSASFSAFNLLRPKVEQNRMEYIHQSLDTAPVDYSAAAPPADSAVRGTAVIYAGQPENYISVTDIIVFIWFVIAIGIAVYCIISYMLVYRRIKHSCKKEGYYVCADIDTPFIFGLLRPKIYVPAELPDSDLACVLAHEKAHISRCDHIFKTLGILITAVHWFNPLIWLAIRLMTSDMEISCDEKALENMKSEMKKTYAASLLNISMKQNKISLTGITNFGESNIKRRIKYVLAIKKPDTASIVFAVIIIAAASVTMLANAETKIFSVTSELLSIDNEKENIPYNNHYQSTSHTTAFITTAKTEICNRVIVSSYTSTDFTALSTENTTIKTDAANPDNTEADNCAAAKPEEEPIHDNGTVPGHTADEFKSILYNGACYSAFYGYRNRSNLMLMSIPEKEVGKKLYDGTINIAEYSKGEAASDDYKPKGSIYYINGITDDFGIAVKYENISSYYLYTNPSYYSETAGDFISSFSLRETLCTDPGYEHSAQHYYRNINDKGYYDFITEYYDIDVDFVLDMLLDNADAPHSSFYEAQSETPDYSIYCFIPLLNTRISFNIYEKYGYISAGAEGFYIGEEKARKIIDKIQSEYPCCETLIDKIAEKYKVKGKYEP